MQVSASFRDAIAAGSVTLTFRRWKRCQVVAGHRYRTAAGRIEVDAVEVVDPADVTDADAQRAGFPSAREMFAGSPASPDLPLYRVEPKARRQTTRSRERQAKPGEHNGGDNNRQPFLPLYRVVFHAVREPDPRDELAATDALDANELATIDARLSRLDRASSHGPWTESILALIGREPGVRAADLAASVGRDTEPFKLDVRKLKNLGLTISLIVGYRLSPRGEAYQTARGSVTPPE